MIICDCSRNIYRQVLRSLTISCPLLPPLTTSGAMYSMVPQNEYALPPYTKNRSNIEFSNDNKNY